MAEQATLSISSILEIPGLSSGAVRVLIALISFRNRSTGRCCPRINTLRARMGGIPYSTTRRWIRELRDCGIVETHKSRLGWNSYDFHLSKTSCGKRTPPVGSEPVSLPENEPCAPLTDERCPALTFDRSAAPASLYEPDRKEPTGGNCAADVKMDGIGETEKPPAAAPPPPLSQEAKTPEPGAAPRVAQEKETEPQARPVSHPQEPADQIASLARAMAAKLNDVHPQPGLPRRAAPELESILRGAANVEAMAELIWNRHAAWVDYWRLASDKTFIPHLWRWLRDGDWEQIPVIRKPHTSADRTIAYMRDLKARGLWRA